MADDPVVPVPSDPTPSPSPSPSQLTCEFCECVLAKNGEVLKVGKRAKRMRDLEDEVEDRDRTISERDAEISRHKQRIAELEAKLPKKGSSGF